MQFPDHDLFFTASAADHVDRLQRAVTLYLAADASLPETLNTLLDDDPTMPMALCLQGYLMKLAAHPNMRANLQEVNRRAQASKLAANQREQAHIKALGTWIQGDVDGAIGILEAITADHPQDMIALRVAHYLHFYNGSGQHMTGSTTKVLNRWPTDHPHYSFLLGMHAFGLEESGAYAAARQYANAALAIQRHDLWAIHAMDHVYYMSGDHKQGIQWLVDHGNELVDTNNFRNHLHWHHALHYFALDDLDACLSIYDTQLVETIADDFYLDLCNNAALLWRCEERGADVGTRWQPLAEIALQHIDDQELVFASLHYLLPILRQVPAVTKKFEDNLTAWGRLQDHQGQIATAVGLPVVAHMKARQERVQTHQIADLHRLGGSKAQRELFILPH